MSRVLFAALVTALCGCATSAPSAPRDRAELVAACDELASGAEYGVRLEAVESRLPDDALASPALPDTLPDEFLSALDRGADIWRYDASSDFGGMRTGDAGIVAILGCEVVAQQTLIIYN